MEDIFRDQVVIVTGASAGIGKSLALMLGGVGEIQLQSNQTDHYPFHLINIIRKEHHAYLHLTTSY